MSERTDIFCTGMRVEELVGEVPGGDAYDYEPGVRTVYKLFCFSKNKFGSTERFIFELSNRPGWCGSGWTTSCDGFMCVEKVRNFGPATHLPKEKTPIKLDNIWYDWGTGEIDDENGNGGEDGEYGVYEFVDQGDSYYPNNFYEVNFELFEELPRAMSCRPVWIFKGDSGAGKTTLGYYLSKEYTVFDTDSVENGVLPEEIWADVIVLGNKWPITVDDVKNRVLSTNIIEVDFKA